jgi:hypothetical protein
MLAELPRKRSASAPAVARMSHRYSAGKIRVAR